MQTETLTVRGMSCGACVGHVTRALEGVEGVQSAQVNLEAEQAVVTYDPARTGLAQMREAVAEEGYEVVPSV